MILAYKLRHREDFTKELRMAKQIALYVADHPNSDLTPRTVQRYGLDSTLSKQLIKAYRNNKQLKRIKHVNLVVPSTCITLNRKRKHIVIPALNTTIEYDFPNDFERIALIEISSRNIFISVVIPDVPTTAPSWVGIDLNTKGHIAVLANPSSGKVCKLGRSFSHTYRKYNNIISRLGAGSSGGHKLAERRDKMLHNMIGDIGNRIIDIALKGKSGICLERLGGRKPSPKNGKKVRDRDTLNSWIFSSLVTEIETKARLRGIPIVHTDPYNTSKICCACGHMGNRHQKTFECPVCGHIEHADVNAAFNIALRQDGMIRSHADRGVCEGSAGTPEGLHGWTHLRSGRATG